MTRPDPTPKRAVVATAPPDAKSVAALPPPAGSGGPLDGAGSLLTAVGDGEALLRPLIETSPDCIKVLDVGGRLLAMNPQGQKLLGIDDLGPYLNTCWVDWWAGDERAAAERALAEARAGRVGRFEAAFAATADGTPRWWDVVVSPIFGPGGEPERLLSVSRDVTQRWQLERERARADAERCRLAEQRRMALDAAQLGWWHLDPVSGEVSWDQTFRAIFGVDVGRLAYDGVLALIHPDDRARVDEAVRSATRADDPQGYAIEYRVVRPDGSVRWVRANGKAFFEGEGAGRRYASFVGTVADTTAARAAEQALRDSENELRQIVHDHKTAEEALRRGREQMAMVVKGANVGVWCCPLPFDRLVWDEKVKEHFHLPPDAEVTIDTFYERIHPDDREATRRAIELSVEQRRGYDVDYRTVSPDGRRVNWVRAIGRAYYGDDGRPVRFDGISVDVSERKRAERERELVIEAERAARAEAERVSRMKDEFLATLSHELRTPLNAILGWSQILQGAGGVVEDLGQGLEIIERNARAQAQIIEDLLDMSRIISGKVRLDPRRLDLAAVVRAALETARPAAEAKGVRLETEVEPAAVAFVRGDPGRLQQVLWNLLSNAIKFTPRGGGVRVRLGRAGDHFEVGVADTGEGIRPDFLPFVFDRFRQADATTTRRHGGLGLGLSIVKQLVELHGGSARVESEGPGRGATFCVALPAADALGGSAPDVERPAARGAPSLADLPGPNVDVTGVRVLVVDDEADARDLARRLLEDRGAVVTTAATADEALRLVAGQRFDVLVSDVGMPGEDGYALLRRVRALDPAGGDLPAIALTAYARAEDRMKAVAAGFLMHVAKPVEPAELLTMIAGVAGRIGR